VRQRLALVGAEAGRRLAPMDERRNRLDTGIDRTNQEKFLGQNFARGKLRTDADEFGITRQLCFQFCQVQLTTAMHQRRFQNLVLRRDRAAFKNMAEAMREGGGFGNSFGGRGRQAVCRRDHLAKCALLEKSDLAELLAAHLFIGYALEFFRAGLVDDMGDFLFGQFATNLVFLTLHRHVPLL
jgi:hypothetical protein